MIRVAWRRRSPLLLGDAFSFMELTIIPDYRGFLVAILPPGGFLLLGFLLAGKRMLDRLASARRNATPPSAAAADPA